MSNKLFSVKKQKPFYRVCSIQASGNTLKRTWVPVSLEKIEKYLEEKQTEYPNEDHFIEQRLWSEKGEEIITRLPY